jgi:hypothetical protein
MRILSSLTIAALSFATANAASLKASSSHEDASTAIKFDYAAVQARELSRVVKLTNSKLMTSPSSMMTIDARNLAEDSTIDLEVVKCFNETMNLGPGSALNIDMEAWLSEEDACNQNTLTCDLTSLYATAKTACDAVGGKIIKNDLIFCKEDFASIRPEAPPGDISILNIPMCFAQSCADDTHITDIFKVMIEFIKAFGDVSGAANVPDFKFITGEKCDSGQDTTGSTSSAGGANTFGSFFLATTVGIVALYTF